jgi:hypothetical protein
MSEELDSVSAFMCRAPIEHVAAALAQFDPDQEEHNRIIGGIFQLMSTTRNLSELNAIRKRVDEIVNGKKAETPADPPVVTDPAPPVTAPVSACETRTDADAATDADPKRASVLLWVAVICCHIWSAIGVLWAHVPSRPPRRFVFLMLVVTGSAVLLFLAGLAGGPALEAVPVPTSSNSTGPDNTTNATSVAVRMVANRVVAISDGLRQFLQLSCTADIKVAVVYLAVHLQPVVQRFLQQLGVQRHEPPRQRQTHGDKNDDSYFWGAAAVLVAGAIYVGASLLCP